MVKHLRLFAFLLAAYAAFSLGLAYADTPTLNGATPASGSATGDIKKDGDLEYGELYRRACIQNVTVGGSANAIQITSPSVPVTVLTNGLCVKAILTSSITTAATFQLDGLTAKSLRKQDGTAAGSGDANSGILMEFDYVSSDNSGAGGWRILDPVATGGGGPSLPVSIANGGTAQTTAPLARSSSGLNIDAATGHGDSNYTILATDRAVLTNAAFTAPRTWTLPAASGVNAGQHLIIADAQGTVTGTNTLTVSRAGSDTINGGTTVVLNSANGYVDLVSDGTSKWAYAPAGGGGGSGTVTSITISAGTGITISGTCSITTSGTCTIALTNTATTVNGQTCTLGSTCTVTVAISTGVTGLGAGVATPLGIAPGSTGSFTKQNGAITNGNCLQWSASGVQDAGAACGSGGGEVTFTSTTAVSAAGTTQGTATALTSSSHFQLWEVTTATGNQGVKLPTSAASYRGSVANNTGAVIKVYPAGSGTINGASYIQLAPGGVAILLAKDASDNWYVEGSDGWVYCYKPSDNAIASNTTLTSDPDLQFSMAASTNYEIEAYVYAFSPTLAGFKLGDTGPASPNRVINGIFGAYHTTPATIMNIGTAYGSLFANNSATNSPFFVRYTNYVRNGSNSGTFALQFAQSASNATATTFYASSWLRYRVRP